MVIIVGAIIRKGNQILMVKESKKEFYGNWNFPSGHLEEGETIEKGILRETLEETGCKVEFKSSLPVRYDKKTETFIIYYMAELIEEHEIVAKEEILEKKWMTFEEIRSIKDNLRYPDDILEILENIEKDFSDEFENKEKQINSKQDMKLWMNRFGVWYSEKERTQGDIRTRLIQIKLDIINTIKNTLRKKNKIQGENSDER